MKSLKSFTSQKALKDYVKTIIDEIQIEDDIKNKYPEHYKFFCELFTRHPNATEKVKNMNNLKIVHNAINPKYFELQILYDDKRVEAISYNCCISGKSKDGLKIAMREAIDDQIQTFRNNNVRICQLCNKTKGQFHIDHIKEFNEIFTEFFKEYSGNIPTIFDTGNANRTVFKECDKEFRNLWSQYHAKNATLRVLCIDCNLSRPNKTLRGLNNLNV